MDKEWGGGNAPDQFGELKVCKPLSWVEKGLPHRKHEGEHWGFP